MFAGDYKDYAYDDDHEDNQNDDGIQEENDDLKIVCPHSAF